MGDHRDVMDRMPEMLPVTSSAVAAFGYDACHRDLYVRFRETGETYVYHHVDLETAHEFASAASMGAYLNQQIKPVHEVTKLSAA
jgi:hypothetical protein